jgi:hypothetical protein
MDWKALRKSADKTDHEDMEFDRMLFAAVESWSYPLVGAAYNEFERRLREGPSVSYTGNAEAALAFARDLFPHATFEITIDAKDKVTVRIGGRREADSGASIVILETCKAPSIALGVIRAALAERTKE